MTKRKPRGYWESLENTITEARKAMSKHRWATLPSGENLAKHGYNSLPGVINKYHGGIQQFRTTLGQTNTRKPHGYWLSLDNTLAEAQQAMQQQGWNTLPPTIQLREYGYNSLNHAIVKYHGGIYNFRKTLGQTNPEKPKGYWQSLDNTLAEAQQAMQQQGWETLPSTEKLQKKGYCPLANAINKYYGGIRTFRTTLGQTNTRKQPGYWQQEENTIAEARKAMQKHGWRTIPSPTLLGTHGYSSLSLAINKYHGGFAKFRKRHGLAAPNVKPKGYWLSLDNSLKEAQQAIAKHGWAALPSQQELAKHGYTSLSTAIIKYHRGFHQFRNLLAQHITGKTQKQQLEELLDEYIAA